LFSFNLEILADLSAAASFFCFSFLRQKRERKDNEIKDKGYGIWDMGYGIRDKGYWLKANVKNF